MFSRIFNFLIGMMFVFYGIFALTLKKINTKPGMAPVTDLNFGYLWLIAGFLLIGFGVAFLYLSFRSEKRIKNYPYFLRCVGCGKFYNFSDVKENPICKACGEKLVKEEEYENAINQKEAERLRAERIANGIIKSKKSKRKVKKVI